MTKRSLKILLRGICLLLVILLASIWMGYCYLSTLWKDFYTVEAMKSMAANVDAAAALPADFYTAYEQLYPGHRDQTLGAMSAKSIWYLATMQRRALKASRHCHCIQAAAFLQNKVPAEFHSWAPYVTAHGIVQYSSERKCLDFVYQKLGIENSALRFFSKPLDQLSQKECAELIGRVHRPAGGSGR